MPLHEGSHLPPASHLWLRESLWHFALWGCLSPTHFFPYTQDETMVTIFDFSYILISLIFTFSCFMALQLQPSSPHLAAVSQTVNLSLFAIAFSLLNLLCSVSNLKVVRAGFVSSKFLCTLNWFIYVINHGTWVNICQYLCNLFPRKLINGWTKPCPFILYHWSTSSPPLSW